MRPFSRARPFLRNRFLSFNQLSLPEGSPTSQFPPLMAPFFQLSPLPSPLSCQTSIRRCRGPAHHPTSPLLPAPHSTVLLLCEVRLILVFLQLIPCIFLTQAAETGLAEYYKNRELTKECSQIMNSFTSGIFLLQLI